MSNTDVFIVIGGKRYTGWESVSIRRSIESLCGNFEVILVDRQDGTNWKLATQKEITVVIGDDLVLTGFIDVVDPSFTKDSHTVTVKGRDKTCDLVDCSTSIKPNEYRNLDLESLIKKVCAPFKIDVVSEIDSAELFKVFAIQKGETVFEVIDRACRMRGVLPITDSKGRLTLTTSGIEQSEEPLIWGENVKEAKATFDYTNRFSSYTVHAQDQGNNAVSDIWGTSPSVASSGVFTDPQIRRYRPLLLSAETTADTASCKKRAELEASVRSAKSQVVNVVVQGWRQRTKSTPLWKHNMLVNVDIPVLFVNCPLLITEVNYTLSNQNGSECSMRLMREDAFNAGTKFKVKHAKFSSAQEKVKKVKNLGFDFGSFVDAEDVDGL